MYYVYLIKSVKNPELVYVGYTTNLQERLETHNSGGSVYTASGRPWELVTCLIFTEKFKAIEFEKYLKSHAGRTFTKKHFW